MRGAPVRHCVQEGRCLPPAQTVTLLSACELQHGQPVQCFGQDWESDPWVLFPALRENGDLCLEQEWKWKCFGSVLLLTL